MSLIIRFIFPFLPFLFVVVCIWSIFAVAYVMDRIVRLLNRHRIVQVEPRINIPEQQTELPEKGKVHFTAEGGFYFVEEKAIESP